MNINKIMNIPKTSPELIFRLRESSFANDLFITAVSQDKILVPCGRCREMMLQINKGNMNTKVILLEKRTILLKELLPES